MMGVGGDAVKEILPVAGPHKEAPPERRNSLTGPALFRPFGVAN
jgi:hypothetical protein